MSIMLIELTKNNKYKNKFSSKTCSILANKKQGIIVNKRR